MRSRCVSASGAHLGPSFPDGGLYPYSEPLDDLPLRVRHVTPPAPAAVMVQIDGRCVGYLSRNDARLYRAVIDRLAAAGLAMGCHARLTGGWDRGRGDRGTIGVRLMLATPTELWVEMDRDLGPQPSPYPPPVAVGLDAPADLAGKTVCFTGDSGFGYHRARLTHEMQMLLAEQHGMVAAERVTKKTDVLVIGPAHLRSGKVSKAEEYGIPILDESAFWAALGVRLDTA